MKRTLIALAALTVATPAFAQQVSEGTSAARAHFAQSETGNEARVYIDGMEGLSAEAIVQFERELASQDMYNGPASPSFNTNTDQYANETARRILDEIAMEDEGNAS